MGKSWSGAAQQELPAEPKGLALNGHKDQQVLAYMIVEHNVIACNMLLMESYDCDVMKITLKPIKRTNIITIPHMQDRIEF
jgi:hypothetical protein